MADTTTATMQDDPRGSAPPPAAAGGAGGWPAFRDYLLETKAEVKRITWPEQDHWVNSSVITLLTIVALSALMAVYNAIFNQIAGLLFG